MVNKVILVGNLGRDPEVRSLPNGQAVANFTLATSRRFKGQDGSRQEKTEWHNITVYGKSAEIAGQYLTKGKQIFLEGRIETRSWDDKTSGEKKYKTEIICDNFQMLGAKSGGAGGGEQRPPQSTGGAGPDAGHDYGADPSDDDIPF
jgi:single-strand DNA-binding protein